MSQQDHITLTRRGRVGVDDLVQETLLRGLLAVGTLDWQGEAAFRSWLLTIADNVAREAVYVSARESTSELAVILACLSRFVSG